MKNRSSRRRIDLDFSDERNFFPFCQRILLCVREKRGEGQRGRDECPKVTRRGNDEEGEGIMKKEMTMTKGEATEWEREGGGKERERELLFPHGRSFKHKRSFMRERERREDDEEEDIDVEELPPMHVWVRVKERQKKRPMRGEDGGGEE